MCSEASVKTPECAPQNAEKRSSIYTSTEFILAFLKSERRVPPNFSLRFHISSIIYIPSPIDMSRRDVKAPIDEAEQQRLRDEEEARRIEARRL